MSSRVFLLILIILVLIGSIALLAGTRLGIGASPDSVYYIAAARNLLDGRGYSLPAVDGSDTPLTHLPPFYSTFLALLSSVGVEVIQVARWVSVVLFGAGILIIGLVIGNWAAPRERWIALAGAFVFLTSIVVLDIHLMAWSEPLFILLGLFNLITLARYLNSQKMGWLVASALFTGMALLTRFAGAAFVVTGAIGILLFTPSKPARRMRDTLLFAAISSLPMLAWLINNLATTGKAANREIAFHPIGKHQASQALTTLASWVFIPDTARTLVKAGIIVLLALGISAVLVYVIRRENVAPSMPDFMHLEGLPPLVKLLVVFLVIYPAFLVFSLTFFDANTPLDRRILSPIFVIALVLACYVLIEAFKWFEKSSIFKWVVIILACALCAAYLAKGASLLSQSYLAGIGFNSAAWQHSPTLKSLQQLPRGAYIYSNAPDGIFFQTGRPAVVLPKKYDLVVQRPNPDYAVQMRAMFSKIEEEGGVIVYFKGLDWPNVPNEQELLQMLPVRMLEQYTDATIYGAAPK